MKMEKKWNDDKWEDGQVNDFWESSSSEEEEDQVATKYTMSPHDQKKQKKWSKNLNKAILNKQIYLEYQIDQIKIMFNLKLQCR